MDVHFDPFLTLTAFILQEKYVIDFLLFILNQASPANAAKDTLSRCFICTFGLCWHGTIHKWPWCPQIKWGVIQTVENLQTQLTAEKTSINCCNEFSYEQTQKTVCEPRLHKLFEVFTWATEVWGLSMRLRKVLLRTHLNCVRKLVL